MSSIVYVCIDSRDRNRDESPDPSSYVVRFAEPVRNVRKVELVYAQYERFSPDNYFVVIVGECSPNSVLLMGPASTGAGVANAFTVLPQNESFNQYTTMMYRSAKVFDPPRSRIDRLTISFRLPNGEAAVAFKEHMLRFELRCDSTRADLVPRQIAAPPPADVSFTAGRDAISMKRNEQDGVLAYDDDGGLQDSSSGSQGSSGSSAEARRDKYRKYALYGTAALVTGGASYGLVRKYAPRLLGK